MTSLKDALYHRDLEVNRLDEENEDRRVQQAKAEKEVADHKRTIHTLRKDTDELRSETTEHLHPEIRDLHTKLQLASEVLNRRTQEFSEAQAALTRAEKQLEEMRSKLRIGERKEAHDEEEIKNLKAALRGSRIQEEQREKMMVELIRSHARLEAEHNAVRDELAHTQELLSDLEAMHDPTDNMNATQIGEGNVKQASDIKCSLMSEIDEHYRDKYNSEYCLSGEEFAEIKALFDGIESPALSSTVAPHPSSLQALPVSSAQRIKQSRRSFDGEDGRSGSPCLGPTLPVSPIQAFTALSRQRSRDSVCLRTNSTHSSLRITRSTARSISAPSLKAGVASRVNISQIISSKVPQTGAVEGAHVTAPESGEVFSGSCKAENDDAVLEYFLMTCLAVNMRRIESGLVPVPRQASHPLYQKAQALGLPMHAWHKWVSAEFDAQFDGHQDDHVTNSDRETKLDPATNSKTGTTAAGDLEAAVRAGDPEGIASSCQQQ